MRTFLKKLFPERFARPSNDTRARMQLQALGKAIVSYHNDTGELPRSLEDILIDPGKSNSWKGPYLPPGTSGPFLDPWGFRLQYRTNGVTFELESRGLLGHERDYG